MRSMLLTPKASSIEILNRPTFSSPAVVTPKFSTSGSPSFIRAPQHLPVKLRPLFLRNISLAPARRSALSLTCPRSRPLARELILALTFFPLVLYFTKCLRALFHFPVALLARFSIPSCTRHRYHLC